MSKIILPKSMEQRQVDQQVERVARRVNPRPKPGKLVISKEQADLVREINKQVARQQFLRGVK